jgi:hypothetical protein
VRPAQLAMMFTLPKASTDEASTASRDARSGALERLRLLSQGEVLAHLRACDRRTATSIARSSRHDGPTGFRADGIAASC